MVFWKIGTDVSATAGASAFPMTGTEPWTCTWSKWAVLMKVGCWTDTRSYFEAGSTTSNSWRVSIGRLTTTRRVDTRSPVGSALSGAGVAEITRARTFPAFPDGEADPSRPNPTYNFSIIFWLSQEYSLSL